MFYLKFIFSPLIIRQKKPGYRPLYSESSDFFVHKNTVVYVRPANTSEITQTFFSIRLIC